MPLPAFPGRAPADVANGLDNWLQSKLQPLAAAWQTGRLAIVWGATPFDLAPEPASRPAIISQWQEQAKSLPGLGHDLDLSQLPVAPILSLDPSDRLLRLFNRQQLRVSIVRDRDEVPQPGEHIFYPLAGDLARREGLVLTRQDLRQVWQNEIKQRWMLAPWLQAALQGAVLLLGVDPGHPTFAAWWADLLGPALAQQLVFASAEPGSVWPAGVIPIDAGVIAQLSALTPRKPQEEPMPQPSPSPAPPLVVETLAVKIYRSTVTFTVQGIEYSGPNRIDPPALLAAHLDLDRYGEQLFEGVFHHVPSPGGVPGRTTAGGFAVARHLARAGRLRLELRLDPNDLDLHSYRWETLKEPGDDTPLALQARCLLYRHQPGRTGDLLVTAPRLRVLAAIANPTTLGEPGNDLLKDLTKLDISQERDAIASGLQRLVASGAVDYQILDRQHGAAVSPGQLRAALRDGYHVMHLVAHGLVVRQLSQPHFYLVLEKENGQHEFISTSEFRKLTDNSDVQLVVLVSCLSQAQPGESASLGLGSRLVQAGVPAVIAMQDLLPIHAGRSFSRSFYDELARSGHVDLAMAATRQAMWSDERYSAEAVSEARSWSIPALVVSASGGQLFQVANAQQPAGSAAPGAARVATQPAAQPPRPGGETAAIRADSPVAAKPKLSRFQRMNLETQLGELQTNFATVTKRIQALDIDISRAMSAADRQVFEERKAERVAERDGIVQKIAAIEDQLGTG